MAATNDVQDGVTRMVRVLMALRGIQQKELAAVLNVNASGVTRRMTGGAWTIADLDAMARYFDVAISSFFEDPRTLFDQGKQPSGWITDSAEYADYADVTAR